MKKLFLLGLLLSCSKPIEIPSDELTITSEKCFVKYTIYRIIEDPIDSLQFQLSGIIDCNYSWTARHRIPQGNYLLQSVSAGISKRVLFQKRKVRIGIEMD
jgi:hypothetical protein